MVLRFSLDSTPDTINKCPRVPKILSWKSFKFDSDNRIHSFSLMLKFELMPAEVDWAAEERGFKQTTVRAGSTRGLDMVFTLLTKLIAIHVEFPIVQVGKTSFKRTFFRPLVGSAISLSIHKDFHKPVKVCIGVLGRCRYKSRRKRRNKRGSGSIRGGGSRNIRVGRRRSRQWRTAAIDRWKSLNTSSGLVFTSFGKVPARIMTEARAGYLHRWLDNS